MTAGRAREDRRGESPDLDDRVVAVTGGGNGLGRAYALELARRGAAVVVNDLGGATDGTGQDDSVAEGVAGEIRDAGGRAVAVSSSVTTPEGGAAVTAAALDAFGRIDGVVSNAGILRDRSFAKLSLDELTSVLDVHLLGAFHVLGPAFRWMKENGGGRIVLTTSSSGLFGNFGQANYAMAKMGVVGLTRVLAVEGASAGITANAVAPIAATRLTAGLGTQAEDFPMDPERVVPLVVALLGSGPTPTGEVFVAGGGWYGRAAMVQGPGWGGSAPATAEDVMAHWDEIRSLDGGIEPRGAGESSQHVLARLREASPG